MILPIVAFGDPLLKKRAQPIDASYPDLEAFLENMFETMYKANGVGLAAPQVGKSVRIFIVDASPFKNEHPELDGYKKVFINPEILEENGEKWAFNEGCLSIPGIREDVLRRPEIVLRYQSSDFVQHEEGFSGILARIVQHEYDHLEGKLFLDHLSSLRKTLLKGRLNDISRGKVDVDYKMKFFR